MIYSSNTSNNDGYENTHVWHREILKWTDENILGWKLIKTIKNKYPYNGDYKTSSFSDFYIYEKQ